MIALLKPYADLLRWCLIVGVLLAFIGLGFYSGYKWQADEVADARAETEQLRTSRNAWQFTAEQYKYAVSQWEYRFKTDEAAAAKRKAQAGKILDDLREQEAKSRREAAAWAARYATASKRPDCVELMKESTCPIFADY